MADKRAPSRYSVGVDHRLVEFPPSLAPTFVCSDDDGDAVRSTTFLPKLLYRNVSKHYADVDIKDMSERYKSFGRATLTFNMRSFLEEFISHTGSIIFGPFFCPVSVWCSGIIGAKITGFLPGKIHHNGKAYTEPTQNFISQTVFYFLFDLPIFAALALFLTGVFQPIGGDRPHNDNKTTSANADAAYTIETEVLFMGEVVVPAFILMLRQIVIAVKYAYIPRGHIRNDREAGRNMEAWNDELMVPWCFFPSARMISHNTRLACERARIDPHVMAVEFTKPFCQAGWEIFDTPETNEEAKERAAASKKEFKKEQKSIDDDSDSNNSNSNSNDKIHTKHLPTPAHEEPKSTPPADTQLPLWRLIHFSVWHGSKASTGVGIPPFMLMGLVGALIPPFYKIIALDRPAFGTTSLDKWISACSFLSYFMQGSGAVWLFSYCAGMLSW
jgi:hypothetical protein